MNEENRCSPVLSCLVLLLSHHSTESEESLQNSYHGEHRTQKALCNILFEEEKLPLLGEGAFADWNATGYTALDESGRNSIGTLFIQGRENKKINVRVEASAVIGPLDYPIFEFEVSVPANDSLDIPLDFRTAYNLHPKQLEYITRISAKISIIPESGGRPILNQVLSPRYLAYNERGEYWEIMDDQSREELYPHGFTSADGLVKVQRALTEPEEEGAVRAGFAPGIVITEPIKEYE